MHTIIWTYKEIEGQFQTMAISVNDLFGFNVTFNKDEDMPDDYIKIFDTSDAAIHHMTEINKPNYYERYKLDYELKYVEHGTEEWGDAYFKYENTLRLAKGMAEFVKAPWYKRIFKNFFIRKMVKDFNP